MKKYMFNFFEEGSEIQLYDYLESNRKRGWCVKAMTKFLIIFEKMNAQNIIIGVQRDKEKQRECSEIENEYNGLTKNEYRNNQLLKSGWILIGRKAKMRVYIGDKQKQLHDLEPLSEYKKSIYDKYHTKLKAKILIGSLLFAAALILCFYFDLLLFNFEEYSNNRYLYHAGLILCILVGIPYEALRTWLVHRKLDKIEKDIDDLPVLSYSTYLYVRWCEVLFGIVLCYTSFWYEHHPWIGMIGAIFFITSFLPDAIYTLSLLMNNLSDSKISRRIFISILVFLLLGLGVTYHINFYQNNIKTEYRDKVQEFEEKNEVNIGPWNDSSIIIPVHYRYTTSDYNNINNEIRVDYSVFYNNWMAKKVTYILFQDNIDWVNPMKHEYLEDETLQEAYLSKDNKILILFYKNSVMCYQSEKVMSRFTIEHILETLSEDSSMIHILE